MCAPKSKWDVIMGWAYLVTDLCVLAATLVLAWAVWQFAAKVQIILGVVK